MFLFIFVINLNLVVFGDDCDAVVLFVYKRKHTCTTPVIMSVDLSLYLSELVP